MRRPFASITSHSISATALPREVTRALACKMDSHTGRRKLIFSSRVVKLWCASRVLANATHGSVRDVAEHAAVNCAHRVVMLRAGVQFYDSFTAAECAHSKCYEIRDTRRATVLGGIGCEFRNRNISHDSNSCA
jgi:hypothetical protein